MINNLTALRLVGNTLWIGYGQRTSGGQQSGGLGKVDLATGRFTSFMPSLSVGGNEENEMPTRYAVIQIVAGAADDIWFVTAQANPAAHLRRYQSGNNSWKVFQNDCSALAGNEKQLVAA